MTAAATGGGAGSGASADLRRLLFLVKVIDTGSITRAAEALRIAQPALSQHILMLERSFGRALLVRSKHGVTPTNAGRVAYRLAQLMIRQIEQARTEVKSLSDAPAGRVTVGVVPHSRARALIQPLLRAALDQHPNVLIHIHENFEGILAADLLLERMDMAFLYEIVARPGFHYQPLLQERLCLLGTRMILRPDGTAGPIETRMLGQVPLLLPSRSHALRQLIDAVFSSSQIQPRLVAEVESFETLVEAIRQGLGATILPRSVAEDLAAKDDLAVQDFGSSETTVTLSLCTSEQGTLSDAARVIHELACDLARQLLGAVEERI